MTPQSKMVLLYLTTVPQATLEEVYYNTDLSYYANWEKHTGNILSRLVNSGKVERIKRGIFKIKTHYIPTDTLPLFQNDSDLNQNIKNNDLNSNQKAS